MASRTSLYDWHVAHGARMVEFGGWDMPVQYTSIMDEHSAVRTRAGLFDISHMGRLSFAGPDALPLIQKIYTNNAATMKENQVRYGLVCNDQGGIRDDVLVYRWSYGWAMVVNASNREKIVGWLEENRQGMNVDILDQTLETCMLAAQGPDVISSCGDMFENEPASLGYYYATATRYQGKPCVISRTGYTGEDGFEVMIHASMAEPLWDDLIARGCKPCGLGARDTLRLEAAMPLYGHELSEEIDPFQAGLGWAVKMDKGDFRGRAALEKRQADRSARKRVGLELAGKRIAREGANVVVEGKTIGVVGSGTFSPTFQKPLAMAYLDPAFQTPGTKVQIDIRGNLEAATVVPMPFYKRAKGN